MTLGILIGLAVALLGSWLGFRDGMKRGALLERRAEAMRRLSARAETEWTFRRNSNGLVEPGLLIYGRSPDGHEYTRRFDDMQVDTLKERKLLGYDDLWYEVAGAKSVPDAMQSEITNRYNSWNILIATKAREKGDT